MSSLSSNMISAEFGGQTAPTDKLKQGEFLFNGFDELFNAHPVLGDIHRDFGSNQKLRILCYQLSEYPLLMDALTATINKQNDFLERALFSSWLCFLMADQLKLSVNLTKDLFIAGLVQDIAASGGEHLKKHSPIFSDEAGSLNTEDKGNAHPTITGRFLDTIPRLSSEIKQIVQTHHERFDGTGFPDGKVEQQLSVAQQILIVSNEVSDLCHSHADKKYNFRSILPILKLNASVYFRPVFSAVITVISPSTTEPLQHQTDTIAAALENQNQLSLRWPHILSATAELALLDENATVKTLKQIARRAWMLVTTAGILSDELTQWLSQLDSSGKESRDQKESSNPAEGTEVLLELNVLLGELNTIILSYQENLEILTNDTRVEMTDAQRTLLSDLSNSMGEPLETFDLDEFTILNMCD